MPHLKLEESVLKPSENALENKRFHLMSKIPSNLIFRIYISSLTITDEKRREICWKLIFLDIRSDSTCRF